MTNSKHTKRALGSSIVALLLCFTMLMGATFAWFTDNVSSTGNRIQAGNLEVDLVMDKLDGAGYKSIAEPENDKARGDIFSEATGNGVRWEPGKTQVVYLGVRNNGNLALKYNIVLNIVDNGLAGALEYAIIDGATSAKTYTSWTDVKAASNGQTAALPTGQVIAAQGGVLDEIAYDKTKTFETDYFALAIHMKEDAGNEYENKDVKIDVQVLATQKDAEEDSFGPDYDENAEFESVSSDNYQDVINQGSNIKLVSDIVVPAGETLSIPAGKTVIIDLNGKEISAANAKDTGATIVNNGTLKLVNGSVSSDAVNGDSVISNSGSLTLDNVTINGAPMGDGNYPAYAVASTGTLVIEDGTSITSDRGALNITSGDVTINGGNFVVTDAANGRTITLHTIAARGDSSITINDGNFENHYTGTSGASVLCPWGGDITVYGGTFRDDVDDSSNFNNTANIQNYMGAGSVVKVCGGTFDDKTVEKNVAPGYAATEATGIWTVAKKKLETSTELSEVIESGETEIALADGDFTIPDSAIGKTLTITGAGAANTTLTVVDDGASEGDIDYSLRGSNVVFENMTINTAGTNYAGYAGLSATYNNCTFTGMYTLYGESIFNNCTFNFTNNYLWTWGAPYVEFNNCTFESVDGSAKAILVHNTCETEVIVKDCKFIATNPAHTWDGIPVAAVSIDPENGSPDALVRFEGTNTVSSAFKSLYQVKYADEVDDVKIYVDGAPVTVTAMK